MPPFWPRFARPLAPPRLRPSAPPGTGSPLERPAAGPSLTVGHRGRSSASLRVAGAPSAAGTVPLRSLGGGERYTDIRIGVSIGVALFPEYSSAPDQLVKMADLAMYASKEGGKNRISFSHPNMGLKLKWQ
jgi:hypothetical protein